jgi:AmiR/NasT family two-component response regulator
LPTGVKCSCGGRCRTDYEAYGLTQGLRILIANERVDRLARIAEIVTGLGHEVISRELEVADVAAATEREHPDLAFVGLGMSGEHALEMISEIVREASCPVIALLEAGDPVWVNEAAKRGIFAYIVDGEPGDMQSAIDITLRRYAEFANLQGAFARRAIIERAKGIIMSREEVDEDRAFERLRLESQRSGHRVYDVAQAVISSHLVLVQPDRR